METKPLEKLHIDSKGQWSILKWDLEKRRWTGYEPVPGKKKYSEGSCRPK